MGSLTSCDPSDIMDTIQKLAKERICASIISLAAEIQVCKLITKATRGSFQVAINESHLKELIMDHLVPPAINALTSSPDASSLILMGFPSSATPGSMLCSW